MMHYRKGKNVEEELTVEKVPIANLPKDFLWMKVNGGTKLTNVVDYATKAVKAGEYRSVLWTGTGSGAISKTVSCAEIMKRDFEMHQITRIKYNLTEEEWDPQTEGLDPIVVKRNIPTIFIFLSLDQIDPSELGYQNSKTETGMWLDRPKAGDKRPNGNAQGNRNNNHQGGGATQTPGSSKNNHNNRRSGGGGGANRGRGGGNQNQGQRTPNKNKKPETGNSGNGNASKSMKMDVPRE